MAGTKEIELTKNKVAVIDAEDYNLVKDMKWHTNEKDGIFYARGWDGERDIYMHRLLMGFPECTDHINGNGLDNRRSNLRACTQKENTRNRTRLNKNNTSGYRHIYWRGDRNKWEVQVRGDWVGRFKKLSEAIRARNGVLL